MTHSGRASYLYKALILALILLSYPLATIAAQVTAIKLEVGKPIERALKGGEEHTYEINLAVGQYLDAVVEQKGVDVVVVVITPDGKTLLEVDSPNGTQGPEPVNLVTDMAGVYRLLVKSLDKTVPAGKYEIKINVLRVATENDRALFEAAKLSAQAELLRQAGKYDQALLPAQHALALREKAFGADHPEVTNSINSLAELYQAKGDYTKAAPLYRRALAINEKALGVDHPEVAATLNNLALISQARGDYAGAEPLYRRSLAIREKALGRDHADVAISLTNLAELYRATGDYTKAEPLYRRALAINEKTLGPDHPDVANLLNSLAELDRAKGDYVGAEPLYRRSLAIREKALGAGHPDVANSLNNLAALYQSKGDYVGAEPLYRRALTITEKALGADHPDLAVSLNNLALLYQAKGDYTKAEPLYQRSLSIREKALGPDHPSVATVLNNLAELDRAKGDYAGAEPLYRRSLAIREKALGPDHPLVAVSLNNWAQLYRVKGDYIKAVPLYRRALAINEKALGVDHPEVAATLNNLALISQARGDYTGAEALYRRSLAIREKALGPNHPWVANSLNNLAGLYQLKGNYAKALALRSRSTTISEHNLRLNLAAGSERQKLLYLVTFANETDGVLSLHLQAAPANPAALHLALTTLLRRKGRALDAMAESIAALRKRSSPEQQNLLDQLTAARARLASLTLSGSGKNDSPQYQSEVKALGEQIEKLEDQISRLSVEYRAQSQPVTIQAVQATIPTAAALIEFVSYRPWNLKNNSWQPRRYAAYVLKRQGSARAVDLGDADTIDKGVTALRAVLQRNGDKPLSNLEKEVKPKARSLDELVMRPVRKLLGASHQLLIAPDGALNLIPFAALVDENDKFLVKQYSISYLTSGRDLLRLQAKLPSKQAAIVIADPDFNQSPVNQSVTADTHLAERASAGDTTSGERKNAAPGPKLGDLEFLSLTRLLSTEDEARELHKSLPDAKILTDKAATKAAVKNLSSPLLLHIATHGFFLEDQLFSAETRGLLIRQQQSELTITAPPPISLQNPLLRSGLFFAGANTRGVGSGDDGILTALEASGLDLWGTKLVVLSACDTGVGKVENGEGVYGLRRALVLAGSEAQVMSLWSVSDEGTSELMIDYYKRLKAGEGRSEALRDAQLQMLMNPKRQHPYYWAAFIQSGEWANLDGKR